MGRRERLELRGFGWDLKQFLVWEFLGEFLEKGSTRKHTGNRVARCRKMFGGIFGDLRCFTKRIETGEFKVGLFWGFARRST
jgi:hypothetical protein